MCPRVFRRSLAAFLAAAFLSVPAFAKTDDRSRAMAAVRETFPDCSSCLLFAVPTQGALIHRHSLFVVSTLDRTPSPIWTVAVSPAGKTYLLSYRDPKDWTAMIKGEGLSLGKDDDVRAFAKMFVDLAVGQALFIPKLTPAERQRIEKAGGRPSTAETRIVRGKDRIGITFYAYAKDVSGALQFWNLILTPNGQITKAEVKEY
ncbi:MAG: hypothetical protein V1798_06295 [Pseudomonadota bacterium]